FVRLARCGPMLRHCISRKSGDCSCARSPGQASKPAAATSVTMAFRMAESVILPFMSSLSRTSLKLFAVAALTFAATLPGSAQSRAIVTVEDYQRAERFMNYNTTPLVANGPVRATWLPGDRFWYRNTNASGSEFFLVDAVKGTKAAAF